MIECPYLWFCSILNNITLYFESLSLDLSLFLSVSSLSFYTYFTSLLFYNHSSSVEHKYSPPIFLFNILFMNRQEKKASSSLFPFNFTCRTYRALFQLVPFIWVKYVANNHSPSPDTNFIQSLLFLCHFCFQSSPFHYISFISLFFFVW